ncbi:hypothetical protein BGW36DRAFT_150391 [Talaromyces proteolyticus]|uniref:F-box domain-containing protein n=1 Tax=Talaromyces proteolyticus TaxID=1131652 RepID=A0AAD4Q1R3_9EURO|nr:uncharacterized protein BGW36DRAFT_150391 [Talaromyces proteolyticus]KAH8698775.1 hypothetical protein BGW36DRAFT_150391 [Talaromyces proteolyticus]
MEGAPCSPSPRHTSHASPVKLPIEILRNVIFYADPKQMKNLALVSREFHDIVCALLYRHIHHTFAEGDAENGHMPVEVLAAILETLAGGDHNYAAYVKSFSIAAGSDSCADKIAHELKYDCSSGKLLNALVQAALKKASTLESFKWDIRVELGQSILTALSQKTTLQHLHLRLQPGPSLHSRSIVDTFQSTTPSHSPVPNVHPPSEYIPPPNNIFGHPNPTAPYVVNHNTQLHKNARLGRKLGTGKLTDAPKNISRFSHLRSLAILDIDSYEYISEVAECVANSVPGLRSLKLSFSEKLALKSRNKPGGDNYDAAASPIDDVDDFVPALPPPPALPSMMLPGDSVGSQSQPPSNVAEVRKERNIQEKVLPEILGLIKADHDPSIEHLFEQAIRAAHKDVQDICQKPAARNVAFSQAVREIADNLIFSKHKKSSKEKNALESISKAAEFYIQEERLKKSKYLSNSTQSPVTENVVENGDEAEGCSSSKTSNSHNNKLKCYLEKLCEDSSNPPVYPFDWYDDKNPSVGVGQLSSSHKAKLNNAAPYTKPFQNLSVHLDLEGSSEPQAVQSFSTDATPHVNDKDNLSEIVDMEHPDIVDESDEDQNSADEDEGWASNETLPIDNDKGKMPLRVSEPPVKKDKNEAILEYLTAGHGVSLESLSISLMPVKASVLFRGVDISNLRHLALLNVGSQATFWSMVSKLPDPIKLTSIHTDHVTPEFLHALGRLEQVTELFLFERNRKTCKVAPLTPPSTVGIEDIRQKVLRKHLSSLRRLVIRNENNSTWKFDVKSILSLSNRGVHLKELMIEVNSEGLHRLMQQITKFRSLSALHILFHFRDAHSAMLREIRYNLADTICHCPSIPLEYIGISNVTSQVGTAYVTMLRWNQSKASSNHHSSLNDRKMTKVNGLGPKEKEIFDEWDTDSLYDSTTDDEAEEPSRILKKDVKRSLVQGVKMWQRDTWGMKL